MARYDWEAIEIAYKKGIDIDVISKKYGVVRKTLQNKIYSKKWEVNTAELGNINHDIEALGHSLGKLNGHTQNDPILESIVVERISTIEEDNGLILNNRKLSKMLQGVIVAERKNIDLSNIKAVSGTLKDIESIANPQASRLEISNNNVQQSTTEIEVTKIES
ncbi:MAG: hypothetical protein U9O94_07085 [Nanoarchaeota archaeon]|nr:hypothetical protein [Nanoarchaeota archaeon]